MATRVMFGTKAGAEEWQEELITEHEDQFVPAKAWAIAQGYDRIRIAVIPDGIPDFAGAVRTNKLSGKRLARVASILQV